MEGLTVTIILAGALALSEALSMVPAIRANGIFQFVWNILKATQGKPKKEG